MEINRSRHITYTERGRRRRKRGEKVKRKVCMLFAPGERRSGDDAKAEREGGGLRSVPTTRPDSFQDSLWYPCILNN